MPPFETTTLAVPSGQKCQDSVAVIELEAGVVIVVADGAGGTGCGDLASRAVVSEITAVASMECNPQAWCTLLQQIDHRISAGESTAVVLSVSGHGVSGASVGASQAWFVRDSEIVALTRKQVRKPLLGSGEAVPVGFSHATAQGLLLVSTDGFCNYARKDRFLREYLWHDFAVLPRKLVEMVRLPSGELWDDIGIVACRPRRRPQARKRYSLENVDG